jgi:hypothetical protein
MFSPFRSGQTGKRRGSSIWKKPNRWVVGGFGGVFGKTIGNNIGKTIGNNIGLCKDSVRKEIGQ